MKIHLSNHRAVRRALTTVVMGALTLTSLGGASAATARLGGACARAGQTNARPALVCVATRVGRRTVLRWAAASATTAPDAPTVPGATTVPGSAPSRASGACPDGRWRAGSAQINAFLAEATGNTTISQVQLSGEIVLSFAGGTMTGTGALTGTSSTNGITVEVNAAPVATASYTVSGGTLAFNNINSILNISMKLNGTPLPLSGFDQSNASMTVPVECGPAELVMTLSIPASAASPARTAHYHFLRA